MHISKLLGVLADFPLTLLELVLHIRQSYIYIYIYIYTSSSSGSIISSNSNSIRSTSSSISIISNVSSSSNSSSSNTNNASNILFQHQDEDGDHIPRSLWEKNRMQVQPATHEGTRRLRLTINIFVL